MNKTILLALLVLCLVLSGSMAAWVYLGEASHKTPIDAKRVNCRQPQANGVVYQQEILKISNA